LITCHFYILKFNNIETLEGIEAFDKESEEELVLSSKVPIKGDKLKKSTSNFSPMQLRKRPKRGGRTLFGRANESVSQDDATVVSQKATAVLFGEKGVNLITVNSF